MLLGHSVSCFVALVVAAAAVAAASLPPRAVAAAASTVPSLASAPHLPAPCAVSLVVAAILDRIYFSVSLKEY